MFQRILDTYNGQILYRDLVGKRVAQHDCSRAIKPHLRVDTDNAIQLFSSTDRSNVLIENGVRTFTNAFALEPKRSAIIAELNSTEGKNKARKSDERKSTAAGSSTRTVPKRRTRRKE